MTDDRESLRQKMLVPVLKAIDAPGLTSTRIPGVKLYRSDDLTTAAPAIYEPNLCLILQGEKEVWLGDELLEYGELRYLLAPVTLPVTCKIITASRDKPYLALSVSLDLDELTDLVIDMPRKSTTGETPTRGIAVGDADLTLITVFHRLVELLDSPEDIPVVLPLIKRELLYRVLLSPLGSRLREFARVDSQAYRISKVTEILRAQYKQPLRIKELAEAAHLSESGLFQAFKAVTSMSPLQFQKQLRLNEARRIMLYEGAEASTASYKVGYESPSQFSREYSRLFGAPPRADVTRFRQSL
ncbi:AraC family transcriptional regulator CmrA [Aliidiomarina sedimenti]|uniref:AraC family transcriptional regulator CmrA n=1 Tax=Aliidiomarina sedimenti TaxID=1933879 RepID=A0ABY0C0Q7_9GAMM|nr:AraC family transcriptional regulator [Aliidiomarina sedimenti]RUO30815.1 AraC family transcriptional regulator CmrA [Aliidiomarina sedimenti]